MNNTIVILGGGPAGLLLARLLAERNEDAHIHVYESAADPENRRNDKSFSFAIFDRGFRALAEVPGLDERVRERATTITKRSLNTLPENMRKMNVANPFSLCERDELIAVLVQSLHDLGSARVHLHFGKKCTQVDFAKREVSVAGSDGSVQTLRYDMLFGADGANSVVRRTLEAEHGYACEDKPFSVAYRNFYLNKDGVQALGIGHDEFHGWPLPENRMVSVVPRNDGAATCSLLFPMDSPGATSAQTHWALIEEHCPELAEAVTQDERSAFLQRDTLTCRTIKMERYHFEDHVCLIGDAAHAVPPSIGQGCNSAMEDSAILAQLFDQFGADRAGALAAFSEERVPEMHALLTLSVMAGEADAKLRSPSASSKPADQAGAAKKPHFSLVQYLSTSRKPFTQVLQEQLEGAVEA